jgi:hypothetical protein
MVDAPLRSSVVLHRARREVFFAQVSKVQITRVTLVGWRDHACEKPPWLDRLGSVHATRVPESLSQRATAECFGASGVLCLNESRALGIASSASSLEVKKAGE